MAAYDDARSLIRMQRLRERILQHAGMLMDENDIGYSLKRDGGSNNNKFNLRMADESNVYVFTETAKLFADRNSSDLSSFEDHASCLGRSEISLNSHPKYRSIDGYGNNLKHPHWGTPGTSFGRFSPKAYDDGIHSIRKSVNGSDLPNPRFLVQNILLNAEKTPRNQNTPNQLINFLVLYLSHDLAHQSPIQAFDSPAEVRCCSKENFQVLPSSLSHSACLPIAIGVEDSFYKSANVRCLNFVRAQLATSPSRIQPGEILNKATSFLDLSIVYGNSESESRSGRSFTGGKLNMGAKNILPVDQNGNYLESSHRLIVTPVAAIWPAIFARNHNYLADGLSKTNPNWNDEILFQEARRINIAIIQSVLFQGRVIETVFKKRVNETYNETFDPSTSLEFSTAAYRLGHFYVQPDMLIVDKDLNEERVKHSDTLGRIDLLEKNFDDVLRGALMQPLNFEQYTDEVSWGENIKSVISVNQPRQLLASF
jgi:peroxidase